VVVTHEPDIATYLRRVVILKDGLVQDDRRQEPVLAAPPVPRAEAHAP